MLACMGERKNVRPVGMTSKHVADEWAVRPFPNVENTIQKIRTL